MWIAAVAALAAAAVQSYNTHQTIKHKNQAAAAGIHAQSERARQADGVIAQGLKQLEASNSAKQKLQRGQAYNAALANAQTAGGRLPGQAGVGGSKAYKAALGQAVGDVAADGRTMAGLYAATDAPLYQRQDEAFRIGDLGTDLGTIGRKARDDQGETSLKIQGIHDDPWLTFASQALGAYASASGGGGGGGGGYTGTAGLQPYMDSYGTAAANSTAPAWWNAYGAGK